MDGERGEVRSIVPGGTQTSSIRVPPIICRVSASRTRIQPTRVGTRYAHNSETGEIGSLPRCATWRCLSRCVESYLHGGWLCSYSFSGNKRSNLPRNCKVTLGVKFIREAPDPVWWHEQRAHIAPQKKKKKKRKRKKKEKQERGKKTHVTSSCFICQRIRLSLSRLLDRLYKILLFTIQRGERWSVFAFFAEERTQVSISSREKETWTTIEDGGSAREKEFPLFDVMKPCERDNSNAIATRVNCIGSTGAELETLLEMVQSRQIVHVP